MLKTGTKLHINFSFLLLNKCNFWKKLNVNMIEEVKKNCINQSI